MVVKAIQCFHLDCSRSDLTPFHTHVWHTSTCSTILWQKKTHHNYFIQLKKVCSRNWYVFYCCLMFDWTIFNTDQPPATYNFKNFFIAEKQPINILLNLFRDNPFVQRVVMFYCYLTIDCWCFLYDSVDCWDGQDGYPKIYHGHTLTSHIRFLEVLKAIKEHAWSASE